MQALNASCESLAPGDTLLFPNKTYHFMGGVVCAGIRDVIIMLDGTLKLSGDTKAYPTGTAKDKKMPRDALLFQNIKNVTITSSGTGTFDGNGEKWWGIIKYLEHTNYRPIFVHFDNASELLLENILFYNVRGCSYTRFHMHRAPTHTARSSSGLCCSGPTFQLLRRVSRRRRDPKCRRLG
jgi:hypothetical protein